MKCVGIIAEYNPFHNGHAYHISMAKAAAKADYAIAVMSGDFVQRGEVAMLPKAVRVRHALSCGADMVLLLPTVFSLSSAERFARAGVDILAKSGVIDTLAFGSECNDISRLTGMASQQLSEAAKAQLAEELAAGRSYPDALCLATGSSLLYGPNDVLGMEYIRALKRYEGITPIAIPRTSPHDGLASASAVREAARTMDMARVRSLVPECVYEDILSLQKARLAPRTNSNLALPLLFALRSMDEASLQALPDVSEGLENVILRAARAATSYNELLSMIKSKRYTMSRIKRILMCALTGITGAMQNAPAAYIRVLGVRKTALPLLSELSKYASLPVITRYSDVAKLDAAALRQHAIDERAAAIAALAGPSAAAYESDYSAPLIII